MPQSHKFENGSKDEKERERKDFFWKNRQV